MGKRPRTVASRPGGAAHPVRKHPRNLLARVLTTPYRTVGLGLLVRRVVGASRVSFPHETAQLGPTTEPRGGGVSGGTGLPGAGMPPIPSAEAVRRLTAVHRTAGSRELDTAGRWVRPREKPSHEDDRPGWASRGLVVLQRRSCAPGSTFGTAQPAAQEAGPSRSDDVTGAQPPRRQSCRCLGLRTVARRGSNSGKPRLSVGLSGGLAAVVVLDPFAQFA